MLLHPGSSIEVKDHDFIWLHDGHDQTQAPLWVVVFIKDFEWIQAPMGDTLKNPEFVDADVFATDTFEKARFDNDVIERVSSSKTVCVFNYKLDNAGCPGGTGHYGDLPLKG